MQDQQATRGRWAVAAMFAANGFVMGCWAPQIPLLLPRHQITEFTLGLLILALGLWAVGAMLFAGRLIGRFGSRKVVLGFALSVVPVLPVVVFAPNLYILAPAMALMGAMIGCMDVAMNANAVEVERRLGRAIMSSSHGFWSLGGFVGGAAGGWVLEHWGASVQALLAAVGAAVLVLGAMPFILRDTRAPAPMAWPCPGGCPARKTPPSAARCDAVASGGAGTVFHGARRRGAGLGGALSERGTGV